jgi:hypothetical protein
MAEQPQLNDVLLGEGVKQMQEISREEILRQIFGDIGELADGERDFWIHPILSQADADGDHNIPSFYRLYMCGGKHSAPARENVHYEPVHMLLLEPVWIGEEDQDPILTYS